MRLLRALLLAAIAVAAPAFSGCVIKPPILLESDQAPTRAKALPYKAGLRSVTFARPGSINDTGAVAQWMFIIPTTMVAPMFPNARDESLYIRDSVITYFRDVALFRYLYTAPFDPEDVDIIVDLRFDDFRFVNSTFATSFTSFVSQLFFPVALILPQESYAWSFAATMKLSSRDGKPLGTFKASRASDESVWFVEQPWGNYLWYSGRFKSDFYVVLDSLRKQIEKANIQISAPAPGAEGLVAAVPAGGAGGTGGAQPGGAQSDSTASRGAHADGSRVTPSTASDSGKTAAPGTASAPATTSAPAPGGPSEGAREAAPGAPGATTTEVGTIERIWNGVTVGLVREGAVSAGELLEVYRDGEKIGTILCRKVDGRVASAAIGVVEKAFRTGDRVRRKGG